MGLGWSVTAFKEVVSAGCQCQSGGSASPIVFVLIEPGTKAFFRLVSMLDRGRGRLTYRLGSLTPSSH